MFKRRKPDDLPDDLSSITTVGRPKEALSGSATASGHKPDLDPGPAFGEAAVDTGFGVPPFRSPPPPPASSAQSKESSMARPPSTSGSVAGLPPAVGPRPLPTPARPVGNGPSGPVFQGPGYNASARDGGAPREMAGAQPRDAERRTLVVGRGISLQGNVQDAERLVVEGTIEATMINAAELVVANGGMFKGEVQVDDAEVAGTIDGTLTVRNTLIVRASGKLLGTARCRRLQVEDGGQITGRIEMLTADAASSPTANPPAPAVTPPATAVSSITDPVARDVPSAFA